MTEQTRFNGAGHADLFAEAAARIQGGEPLETVVASYPALYRRNLRDLLAVVALATEISQVAVPAPSPHRQHARKAAFLEAAQRFHAEQEAIARVRPAPVAIATPTVRAPELPAWLAWWRDLFMLPAFRPVAAALSTVLILLVSTTLVTLAEAAVPGDLSYPVKRWIRGQQLYLTPAEERPVVRAAQEQELIIDVQRAQQQADLREVVIEAEGVFLFHGYGAGYLNIGDLVVLPLHQPDPNAPEVFDMSLIGELMPGATVRLRYRILPGQQAAHGPRVVQGIALEVIAAQPVEPTPIPKETLLPPPTPTAPGAPTPTPCDVTVRSGWVPYPVRVGETLTAIASRTGTTVGELRAVNCLTNDFIMAGINLLAPETAPAPTLTAPTVEGPAPTTAAPPAATVPVTGTIGPLPESTVSPSITPGAPPTGTVPAPAATATPDGAEPVSPTAPVTTTTPGTETPAGPAVTPVISETVTPDPAATGIATTAPVTATTTTATPEANEPTAEADATSATPTPEETLEPGEPTGEPGTASTTPTPTSSPAATTTAAANPDEPTGETQEAGDASVPAVRATPENTATASGAAVPPEDDRPSPATPATGAATTAAPTSAPSAHTPVAPTPESAPPTAQPEPPTPQPAPTLPPATATQPPPTQAPPPTQPPPPPPPTQPPPPPPPADSGSQD
jgi:LysM repeat protein